MITQILEVSSLLNAHAVAISTQDNSYRSEKPDAAQ